MNCAGPVHVRNVYGSNFSVYEAWIITVTCSSSRTLYLDIVENRSSTSCVNMLQRFINQYGAPKQVLSYNGSAFTSKEVKEFIALHDIKCSYNIAEAPRLGGLFEHMVRSVKRYLKKILGQARLRFDELLTILKEIEKFCSSRPLTYIYDDYIIEPLSPNHLIHGRAIATGCKDIVNMKETNVSVESLNQCYKQVQSSIEHFWRRWSDEYSKELREQQCIICRTKNIRKAHANVIVLVNNDNNLRLIVTMEEYLKYYYEYKQ